ncbi:MAG: alpha-ketoglutarate-dependent dioxygenase AlkB [Flavobacteriales bacterium]|nr:alpha-ketoglutarate-dependent dioxygenase AlkB [Flavobacteriales bacterium]
MRHEVLLKEGTSALRYYPNAFAALKTSSIMDSISWKQNDITIFGKTLPEPRLTAWFGPAYGYSSIQWPQAAFPPNLFALKEKVENIAQSKFNGCLVNLYRNGNDSMGWHRDNEKEIDQTCIASLTLGEARDFKVRHRTTKEMLTIKLEHGSLLIMENLQEDYEHSLPKRKGVLLPRINMTFRQLY